MSSWKWRRILWVRPEMDGDEVLWLNAEEDGKVLATYNRDTPKSYIESEFPNHEVI